ncbi:ABC transporter permease [Phytoactinopolyspora limicola]|uniref:ABC transporter permease n=1 Tax=Phytoactinopolyspora limicola TaxID=2715536 RepID=UPI00140DF302|nr:ABC transporter permease [Phytoactinopolyspora limicola]
MTDTRPLKPITADARRAEIFRLALGNPKVIAGLVILATLLALGLAAPLLSGHGPSDYVGPRAEPPSADFWFGTTLFGQDVFVQFANGIRSTYVVGLLAGGIGALVGMTVGFVAGYRGGVVDEILSMITNVVLVLPAFAVLIILAAYVGIDSVVHQSVFIGAFSWPWVARAVRAQTFSLRSREFVDLARLTGVRPLTIIRTEIGPNMGSYLLLVFIVLFGGSILTAASLDFLGLGPPGQMSLGLMMNQALQSSALVLGIWWWFLPPGIGIVLIVGALYVTNIGLDDVFNPKLRKM